MEWISVKDRLPERYNDVLCVFYDEERNRKRIDISWVDSTRCFLYEDVHGKVTHWMHLPELPKDD